MRLRLLSHLIWADFLERTRRFSYLVILVLTLIAAAFLVPSAEASYASLVVDNHRGFYNAAWVGTTVAISTTLFLSLIGFYLVKNTLERDEATGVGQILAATPMTKVEYILGKMLSNLLLLTTIVALTALVTPVMLKLRGENQTLELGKLFVPFFMISWPAMFLVSALAVLFEVIPFLRRGLGNIIYFFVWVFFLAILATGLKSQSGPVSGFYDALGLLAPSHSLQIAAQHEYPTIHIEQVSMGFQYNFTGKPFPVFHWNGITWTLMDLVTRIFWVVIALGIVLFASRAFHRFDPQNVPSQKKRKFPKLWKPKILTNWIENEEAADEPLHIESVQLTPLSKQPFRKRYGTVLLAELRLMLKGVNPWWYIVALGLMIATLTTPLFIARGYILPALGIWPLLLWSKMGNREQSYQTSQLIFSTVQPIWRQLPMTWLSGVLLMLFLGSGMLVRFIIAGEGASILALLGGILFIPTGALTLGIWTHSSKLFEILYFLLWYVGPAQKNTYLDFLGVTNPHLKISLFFFMATCVLFVLAILGRKRQLLK